MPASATANSRLFGEGAAPLHPLVHRPVAHASWKDRMARCELGSRLYENRQRGQ